MESSVAVYDPSLESMINDIFPLKVRVGYSTGDDLRESLEPSRLTVFAYSCSLVVAGVGYSDPFRCGGACSV